MDLLEPGVGTVQANLGEDVILYGANLDIPALHGGRGSYPNKKMKGPNSYPKFAFMFKYVLDY